MGNKNRILKKNCPGRKWPQDFAWIRCPEADCSAGYPAQDKYDFPRQYTAFHPNIAYKFENLVRCTLKEQTDHISRQKSLPGGVARNYVIFQRPKRTTTIKQWSCTLCDPPIGDLATTIQHVKDCHDYSAFSFDSGRKIIHALMEEGEAAEEAEEELVYYGGIGRTWLLVGSVG